MEKVIPKSPIDLLASVRAAGLKIRVDGCKIFLSPRENIPAGMSILIRQHKAELLALLEAEELNWPPLDDCPPDAGVSRELLARLLYEAYQLGGVKHGWSCTTPPLPWIVLGKRMQDQWRYLAAAVPSILCQLTGGENHG